MAKENQNDKRVSFRLTDEMRRQLDELSDRRGVSVAELIRNVLHAYLIRQ